MRSVTTLIYSLIFSKLLQFHGCCCTLDICTQSFALNDWLEWYGACELNWNYDVVWMLSIKDAMLSIPIDYLKHCHNLIGRNDGHLHIRFFLVPTLSLTEWTFASASFATIFFCNIPDSTEHFTLKIYGLHATLPVETGRMEEKNQEYNSALLWLHPPSSHWAADKLIFKDSLYMFGYLIHVGRLW